MKIIDAKIKGNLVRFFLGEDDLKEWWGDDWDDRPYDLNCGEVYDEYVSGVIDVAFPFDWLVSEPSKNYSDCGYAREDFMTGNLPLVAVCREEDAWDDDFNSVIGKPSTKTFYMGDKVEKLDGLVQFSREPRVIGIAEVLSQENDRECNCDSCPI